MELTDVIAVGALGLAGGLVGGLLGVGGGILFVPALAIFAGQTQLEAESTSLLAIVAVAALGSWRQHGYGNVRLRDGVLMGVLASGGAVLGVVLVNNVPERGVELAFAALLVVVAIQLVRR